MVEKQHLIEALKKERISAMTTQDYQTDEIVLKLDTSIHDKYVRLHLLNEIKEKWHIDLSEFYPEMNDIHKGVNKWQY